MGSPRRAASDAGAPAPHTPGPVRVLLGANLVSSLGSGLTLPFLLVYLHDVRHISLSVTGLLIGATALVGVPAGPLVGVLVDRLGVRMICTTTVALTAVGTVALVLVRSPVSALPVLAIYGIGQGALWPTWNALFAVMLPDESLRPRVFARSFQLMNLGLGVGAMVAGAFVHVSDPSTFDLIYVVDAATTLALVVGLLALPAHAFPRPRPAHDDNPAGERPGGYREVLGDRRFRRYLLATLFLVFGGYSAVEAGLVGYATHVVHATPSVISWAFGLNTGLIVIGQPFALKLVHRMRRTTALMICAGFFGGSWAVLYCGGLFAGSATGNALVVAMFGVFSLGEVLLAPVGGPLVTMLARPELQGRYNALAATVFSGLNVIGPSIAGVLLGAGLGTTYLAILVGASGMAILAFAWLRSALVPEIDNARVTPAVA